MYQHPRCKVQLFTWSKRACQMRTNEANQRDFPGILDTKRNSLLVIFARANTMFTAAIRDENDHG